MISLEDCSLIITFLSAMLTTSSCPELNLDRFWTSSVVELNNLLENCTKNDYFDLYNSTFAFFFSFLSPWTMNRILSRFCHITCNKVIHGVEFVLFTSPSTGELCESTISWIIFHTRLAWMFNTSVWNKNSMPCLINIGLYQSLHFFPKSMEK